MDDFSSPSIINEKGIPPSPANLIHPGKRPLSSMSPTVLVRSDTKKVRAVAGAAGGTKITTATVYSLIRNVWFGETIKEAVDSRRMHHQLFPMRLQYEDGFPADIVQELHGRGHDTVPYNTYHSVVTAIAVEDDGYIYANSDYRKTGDVSGIGPA